MFSTLLLGLLFASPSLAETPQATSESEAEAYRLTDEMERLAERKAWTGVERTYNKLIQTGADVGFDAYVLAAEAATHLGDVSATRDRLLLATQKQESRMVIDWLWTIDTSYGSVKITTSPGETLDISQVPFDPRAASAFRNAATRVEETGYFEGFLPKGAYAVGDESFAVEVGQSTRVEQISDEARLEQLDRKPRKKK